MSENKFVDSSIFTNIIFESASMKSDAPVFKRTQPVSQLPNSANNCITLRNIPAASVNSHVIQSSAPMNSSVSDVWGANSNSGSDKFGFSEDLDVFQFDLVREISDLAALEGQDQVGHDGRIIKQEPQADNNPSEMEIDSALKVLEEAAADSAKAWKHEEEEAAMVKQEAAVNPATTTTTYVVIEPNRPAEVVEGGRVVVKQEEMPTVVVRPSYDEEEEEAPVPSPGSRPPRQSKTRARQTSKRLASNNSVAGDDGEEEDMTPPKGKKLKLYQQRPFKDPEEERARQNAINAKRNRDRKKKERAALEAQMSQLRQTVERVTEERDRFAEENRRLRAALIKAANPAASAEEDLWAGI